MRSSVLYASLSKEQRELFHLFLALNLLARDDTAEGGGRRLSERTHARDRRGAGAHMRSPRRELIRRMNVAPGATAFAGADARRGACGARQTAAVETVRTRHAPHARVVVQPRLPDDQADRLEELAVVLEKVIAYEAVHEIRGWDDLRRRLAPDRRCFAFFHPALPEDPLIFVEVALCQGLASKSRRCCPQRARGDAALADTAIFYSISNCQPGLRGISFGNFLIKQVVEELRAELPGLKRFATLSPVPGFKRWLTNRRNGGDELPAAALEINWAMATREPCDRTSCFGCSRTISPRATAEKGRTIRWRGSISGTARVGAH